MFFLAQNTSTDTGMEYFFVGSFVTGIEEEVKTLTYICHISSSH